MSQRKSLLRFPLLPLAVVASLLIANPPAFGQANKQSGIVEQAPRSRVDPRVIDELVTANRILAHEGVLDAYGHVSIRDPGRPDRFLIARSVSAEFVTAADIMEYDLNSQPVSATESGEFIERFIHGEIYKARPDVMAIVHSHSAGVVPFSVSSVPLRPVFHMAAFLAGGVPVWEPKASGDPEGAGMLVRNPALGKSLAATLDNKLVVLLRGHGAVVVSRELRSAVRNAIFLEANARMHSAAIALGGSVRYVTPDEAIAMSKGRGDSDRAWEYWKRRALGSK